MDPLMITIYILIASIIYSFFSGLITRNYSTVDRLWSILPAVYALIWLPGNLDNTRYIVITVLIVLWAARLTGNFAVKGGYKFSLKSGFTGEDYRWDVLRKKIPNRILFELFNLFFISGFQLTLIFFFTLPLYYVSKLSGPLTGIDYLLFALQAGLLLTETIADLQQLKFYRKRADKKYKNDKRIKLGFNITGLWGIARHPNYACEMGQWIVVYLYLHFLGGSWHFSGFGAVVLVILFVGSTIMAETITAGKYKAYRDWQKVVPPWIPFIDFFLRRKAAAAFKKKYL